MARPVEHQCMYGTGSARCDEPCMPGCQYGFRFCYYHLNRFRLLLPSSALPTCFVPWSDVEPIKPMREVQVTPTGKSLAKGPAQTVFKKKIIEQELLHDPYRRVVWFKKNLGVRSPVVTEVRDRLEREKKIPVVRFYGGNPPRMTVNGDYVELVNCE